MYETLRGYEGEPVHIEREGVSSAVPSDGPAKDLEDLNWTITEARHNAQLDSNFLGTRTLMSEGCVVDDKVGLRISQNREEQDIVEIFELIGGEWQNAGVLQIQIERGYVLHNPNASPDLPAKIIFGSFRKKKSGAGRNLKFYVGNNFQQVTPVGEMDIEFPASEFPPNSP